MSHAHWHSGRFQIASRYEFQRTDVLELELPRAFDDLGTHEDVALGVAWWFHPSWVAKLSVHQVHGNRFSLPEEVFRGELSEPPPRNTRLVELGVQFSF